MAIKLHDYQQNLVDKTRKSYVDGYKSPCVVAPCGAGKSIIISEIARMTTANKNRVLFLVHRRELVDQIKETFTFNGVDLDYVTFGMVQTIVRRLDRTEKPDLIITDENHHSLAASYRKIYDHFHDVLKLGFTATPIRLNGDGLGDINDILIETVDAEWLIENSYLSPYRYYAPQLIDTDQLKLNGVREFSSASIEESFGKTIYGDVIKHYKQLADGEQAIAYCHSVEASENTADAFNQAGINAMHIDAKTPKTERDKIIQAFRDREITVLCNVDLIGEGFDVPDCSTVIMLRPTLSLSLFIQQSMRGMRYRPGKTSIIIDHVDNVRRHGLPDSKRHWSLEGRKRQRSEATIKIRECENCFAVYSPTEDRCPLCGHAPQKEEVKEKQHDTEADLKEVSKEDIAVTLDFRKPSDCKTMGELIELGKNRGYKKPQGWAYHQAKHLGIL